MQPPNDFPEFVPSRSPFPRLVISGCAALGVLIAYKLLSSVMFDHEEVYGPLATLSEAAKVIDLAKVPLVEGELPLWRGRLADLTYETGTPVQKAFEFHQRFLTAQGWRELPQNSVNDQSASATFARNGYRISLQVFPTGMPGNVMVTLHNHGNVNLKKLPVPPDAKLSFPGPVSAMYVTDSSVDATRTACHKLLLAEGWQSYGSAGDSRYFKQHTVQLDVRVTSAPALGGKTIIEFTSELMSADLPPFERSSDLRFADMSLTFSVDASTKPEEVVKFYQTTLAKQVWEPTTDHAIQDGPKQFMIFHNPQKDMITLNLHSYNEKTNVELKQQSAAEVAEIDRQIKEQLKQRQKEAK